MSARNRRNQSDLSLSFLDCVCCAFGAIILLLVISKSSELTVMAAVRDDLQAEISELQAQLSEVREEVSGVDAEVRSASADALEAELRATQLSQQLARLRTEFADASSDSDVQTTIENRLRAARQKLTEEMKRLLGQRHRRLPTDSVVGGIPVDSEYVIFVVDTSGSMQEYAWRSVKQKIQETLQIYPTVKGIQVMNDMGDYMFSRYRNQWIPDSPSRRKSIVKRLASWRPFSNSSPVEGIEKAVRRFYSPDKKISIYVFGDEFTGGSIEAVASEVDRLNKASGTTERRVRIHAVGFPTQFKRPYDLQATGIRFATLMRVLAERNGGSFVGLSSASR
jgi:hypothetical protein